MEGDVGPELLTSAIRHADDDSALSKYIPLAHSKPQSAEWRDVIGPAEARALALFIMDERDSRRFNAVVLPKFETLPSIGKDVSAVYRTEVQNFRIEPVVTGLRAAWSIVFLRDGSMLVSEKNSNSLRLMHAGNLDPEPILGTPNDIYRESETDRGTVLDIKLHPQYKENGWIYLSYAERCQKNCPEYQIPRNPNDPYKLDVPVMLVIVRGRIENHEWRDEQTIWRAPAGTYSPFSSLHLSGEMAFDGRGYLYFCIGVEDHVPFFRQFAQDFARPNGKIHRIRDDGRMPDDNPFVRSRGSLPSIWSYGHRVHQGLAFDPFTGTLWSAEHGLILGDELNTIHKGRNYGWPLATYGLDVGDKAISREPEPPGFERAIFHWATRAAPSRLHFYQGNRFPRWRGNLFMPSIAYRGLYRLVVSRDRLLHQEVLLEGRGRFRNITESPDGSIYLIVEEDYADSQIVRLVPVASAMARQVGLNN